MINAHTCDKGFKKTRLAVQLEIRERTGKANSFIDSEPECPEGMSYLWGMYNKIIKGCERVGYVELVAFSNLVRIELTPQESDILIDVDNLRRKIINSNR